MITSVMRGVVAGLILALTPVTVPGTASAQKIDLSGTLSAEDPITHLKPVDWVRLMVAEINTKTVVGKPLIYIVNATGRELISLTCDGRWQLAGPAPYKSVKDNPASLPAWRVTLISTEGFDGYCTKALVATSDGGEAFPTKLVSPDGSFRNATVITIMP
jgi:hypothetical protein